MLYQEKTSGRGGAKKERTDMDDIWITVLGYLTGFAMGIMIMIILLRTIL